MMYSAFRYNSTGLAAAVCTNCSQGASPPPGAPGCPFQRGNPSSLQHRFEQVLSVAPSPDGPWSSIEVNGLTTGWDWNTAPHINDDGSAVALIRGGMVWYVIHRAAPAAASAIPASRLGLESKILVTCTCHLDPRW